MNVYETVTNRIIAALDSGVVPWRRPWKADAAQNVPSNFVSRKSYRGVNILLLVGTSYGCNQWLTYKQAQSIGAQVRKGERGTQVVYWRFDKQQDEDSGKWSTRPLCKFYTVFNVGQCDGIPASLPFPEAGQFDPIDSAQRVVDGYLTQPNRPGLEHGGDVAAYYPGHHKVLMPHPWTFADPQGYYATIFHEFGHSTAHPRLLNRRDSDHAKFGSSAYSKEELIAEFCSAFCCAETGISNEHLEQQTQAYVHGWLHALRNDKTLAVSAAQRAQRAADMILGAEREGGRDD